MALNINIDHIKKMVYDKFSINVNNVENNVEVQGTLLSHKFDYIASNSEKIAIKIIDSLDATSEIMAFHSELEDCNINNSMIIVNRELSANEINILKAYDIKISDYRNYSGLSYRFRFGIPDLDMQLFGGLRSGFVYLISGKAGSGKTTLSSMFLSEGAKNGQNGIMILTDTFPEEYLNNIKTMNINFYENYKNGIIDVIEISDQIRSMKIDVLNQKTDFRKFITKIISELKKLIISKNIKRVVIDQVTLLLMPNDDYINLFINSLAMNDVIVIITSDVRASDFSVFGVEENYVTGIIKLEYKLTDTGMERTMRIPKMRGSQFNPMPMKFNITSNGIEIISSEANNRNNFDDLEKLYPYKDKKNDDLIDSNSLFKQFRG